MNTSRFLIALGVILCLALSPVIALMPTDTAQAQPADSDWPMFRQNPQHTGRSPYSCPWTVPYLKWGFTTGYWVHSSPAIGADGTIYFGGWWYEGKLYAINPDGSQKWNFNTGGGVVHSSPAIGADGTIYVGSDDKKLYAIKPDGTESWNFTTEGAITSSPAIGADGTIYFGTDYPDNKLYAINPDGTESWNFTTWGLVRSSPAIGDDGTIYVGSDDKKLYAIKPDGTESWNFTTGGAVNSSPAIGADGTIYVGSADNKLYAIKPDGSLSWNFTTKGWVRSSPAIGANGTIYVGSDDGKLYAINPDGRRKWSFPIGSPIVGGWWVGSSPAIGADGTIYVGSSDKLCAITGLLSPWPMFGQNPRRNSRSPYSCPASPLLRWSFNTSGPVVSSPAIGADGTIYVGSYDNKLYAINPNGTESWNFTTGGLVISSPAIGANGTIYVGADNGWLYAINPDGTESWNFTTEGAIRSSPVIGDDGTIYVGSYDDNLYAINPDGSQSWNFTTEGDIYSSPAIGADGTIYVGSHDDNLYAINPDGSHNWSFTTGGNIYSSPAIGADGTIYVGSSDWKLYAINPDGTESWNFTTGGPVLSSPAIGGDGAIYVGSDDNKLYAIYFPDWWGRSWNFTTGGDVRSSPAIGGDGTIYVGSDFPDDKLYAIKPDGSLEWSFTIGGAGYSSPAIGANGVIYVRYSGNELCAIRGLWSLYVGEATWGGSVFDPGEGPFYYDWGEVIPLGAEPEKGYRFVNWTGDVETIADVGAAKTTITMEGNYEITANFEQIPPQIDLDISSNTGGSVTDPGEGTFKYDQGTVVNLVAEAEEGYRFVEWTGDVDTIADVDAASTTITMEGNYEIVARFEPAGLCFIATAAYGTPMAEEIQILREFRDEYLLTNPLGQALVDLYYRVSPPVADFINEHPTLKPIMRAGLLPAVAMSTIAVNTSPAEKMAIAGLLVLASVAIAVLTARRRGRGVEYT